MIKRIRLIIDLPYTNTDRESILEEAEFLVNGNALEKTYGEFIMCENFFKTSLEKQTKLDALLCTSAPGRLYLTLPFHTVERGFFIKKSDETSVRILLAKGQTTSELKGYFLVDYAVLEEGAVPELPFVQRNRQVQKLSAFASSSNVVTMDTYFVGPVYEMFFTVKDLSTDSYVDAINSVTLWFNDRERFSLDGSYLKFIEPMKKYGRYSTNAPVYMYSFSIEDALADVPSGQTNMPENQRLVINLYNNDADYLVTVWAQSHNFYYSNALVFESTEMLLNSTATACTVETIPMKVSYTNYANTLTVSYESQFPVSNINVSSTTTDYYTTPNQIIFSNIDSVNVLNYTTVTFSSKGFSNTVCYFSAIGSKVEYNYLVTNPDGVYPTYVDGGQIFHAASLGNLNAVRITTSNLVPIISMDQYRYFDLRTTFDSTLTLYSNSVVYTTVPYTASSGPQQAIMKYDKTYNILWYATVDNSNGCTFTTTDNYFESNVFGCSLVANASTAMTPRGTYPFSIPVANETQGLVVSSTFTSNITCGNSNVYIDATKIVAGDIVYVTGRTTTSGDLKINGATQATSPAGGTGFLVKYAADGSVSYTSLFSGSSVTGLETSLSVNANNEPVYTYYTSTGMVVEKYQGWSFTVTGLQTSPDGKPFNISKDVFDNTYILSRFASASPTLSGHTIQSGTGSALLKIDKTGSVRFAMTFLTTTATPILFIDKIIGAIFVNFTETGTVDVYRENTLLQSSVATPVVLAIDAEGNLFDANTAPVVALSDFFTTQNNVYTEPLYDVSYFADPYVASISSVTATVGTFDGTKWSVNLSWAARNVTQSNVYYHAQDTSTYTLWNQTTSSTNVFTAVPDIWTSNTYSFKVEVDGVFNTPPLPFATTTLALPKNPTYANVSSISATLGTFVNPNFPITVNWSSAVDFLYANVYYHADDTGTWTFWAKKNAPLTSNVVLVTPTPGSANTYSFKVEVFNINNTEPLPFATTTLVVPKYPDYATITSISASLGTFSNPNFPITIDWSSADDFLYANVYYQPQGSSTWTFWAKKNAPLTSNVVLVTPTVGSSNTYSFKVEVFNTDNTEPLPFATTTQVVPKYPDYATITTISTSLGTFSNPNFPITVDWSSAQDFAYANVYYQPQGSSTWTFWTQKNTPTTSNVVQITPTIGSSNTYTFKVEVFNINNPLPLPFATTTQVVPKYPDYATISSVSTSLGYYTGKNDVEVTWTAQDFSQANVYYKTDTTSYTLYSSVTNTTSNIVRLDPNYTDADIVYTFKVEVSNVNNVQPLPFATTTQSVPPEEITFDFARQVDTGTTSTAVTSSITTDPNDNVYFAGDYTGSPSITNEDGSTSVVTLPNSTGVSAFVTKFDSSNAYVFARVLNPANGYSVSASNTRVMFSGYYSGTSSVLKDAPAGSTLATLSRENAGYVVALDSSGTYQWNILVDNVARCHSVLASTGYVGGFNSTAGSSNVYDSTGSLITMLPASSGFYIKFDASTGVYTSNVTLASCNVYDVATDGSLNVYPCGYKYTTNAVGSVLPATTGFASFVAKYSSTDVFAFSAVLESSQGALSVAVYGTSLYIAGTCSSGAILKNTAGTTLKTFPTTTSDSAYLLKLDASTGAYSFLRLVTPGTGTSVAVDNDGTVFFGGSYSGSSAVVTDDTTTLATLPAPSTGVTRAFMVVFNSSGAYSFQAFVDRVTDTVNESQSIAISSNRVYLSGYST